jgi:large subunit ribosomal protein L20
MRVKKGVSARKKHNKIRKATKGYSRANTSSVRRGKQAVTRALVNATRDRKNRKRTFRALWNTRINAAARQNDTSYSKLIAGLKKNKIELNRKILAELAVNEPKIFGEIVKAAKK